MVCLVCGSRGIRDHLIVNSYRVVRCNRCGFQFVHPVPTPEALARYYDQGYAVPFERYAHNITRNVGRIADLERWQPGRGRLLEIGASYGHSLAAARARGWQVAGVELSPSASHYARTQLGLAVFTADLLDVPFAERSFDAAILWHVLEHTHDPVAMVERLFALLRPGGVLGLRVPNASSFGARVSGRAWPWMCPPAHLWFFSPATLPRLLMRHGFEVLEVATPRGDGNNLYQHALMALGGRLKTLGRAIAGRRGPDTGIASAPAPDRLPVPPRPTALQRAWVRLLVRTQALTDLIDGVTRPLITPLEAAGWGDELLCYVRRPR